MTITYLFRVHPVKRARRTRWALSVVSPHGAVEEINTYHRFTRAVKTAKILAIGGGSVEVQQ